MEKLKIVVLESPYDSWSEPLAANFLKDLIGVKLRAYGGEYPYGVLPVDGADLISTHIALCRIENDGRLNPLMCNRWTSLKKCRLHYINFPGLSLLQQAGASEHLLAMEKIISEADGRNTDLLYSGGLSIDPLARTTKKENLKEQSLFFREILVMMYVNYQREINGSELIAGGTIRFKIDKLTAAVGHVPLMANNVELAPVKAKHLAGEIVKIMHLKKFSFEALKTTEKWQYLWEDRLVIKGKEINYLKEAG